MRYAKVAPLAVRWTRAFVREIFGGRSNTRRERVSEWREVTVLSYQRENWTALGATRPRQWPASQRPA